MLFLGEGDPAAAVNPPGGGGNIFRAYDKATGAVLWSTDLGVGTTGAPMTFLANGKQYVAVYAGGKPTPAEINIRPELKHYYQSSMLFVFGL